MAEAPLHADLADGPAGGVAAWLQAEDGVRLRAAHWPGGRAGTVLLFTGRTEYVEKYGRVAADLAARGFCVLTLDWRGQGLSDRALPDAMTGHVGSCDEYQRDIRALLVHAERLALPGPRYLLAHSMGGCIGLRALIRGLPVKAAAFTAPMWGIRLSRLMRPAAVTLAFASRHFGRHGIYAPGTTGRTYLAEAAFAGNVLTTDPDSFAWMKAHALARPELTLGGPSLGWLHEALAECRQLAALPSPRLPALCALGTAEKVVDTRAIRTRMARWPEARLELMPGAEHEILMEAPAIRSAFLDAATALFEANR